MKKIVVLILLAISLLSFAQRNSGFKFGSNISWTSSTRTTDPNFYNYYVQNPSFTYHFGYSWNIKVVDRFSIQTDLIYNLKGSVVEVKDPNDPIWSNFATSLIPSTGNEDETLYFSAPVTVNYMITPHLFVELGGEISITPSEVASNLWNFGLTSGVGYATKYIDVSLRYTHGMSDSEYYSTANFNSGVSSQTIYYDKYRTFQISLTVPVFKHIKKAMHRV